MTIKRDLEDEAQRLAATVRVALSDFAAKTGMQADIGVTWVSAQQFDRAANACLVGEVRIDVGGLSVSA
ncbi:MAG: hypothetical protein I8H71_00920 [Xanthomonadaceae bacterium]|nr:hypothetical protein [Xanthomonadaceae bacterium]